MSPEWWDLISLTGLKFGPQQWKHQVLNKHWTIREFPFVGLELSELHWLIWQLQEQRISLLNYLLLVLLFLRDFLEPSLFYECQSASASYHSVLSYSVMSNSLRPDGLQPDGLQDIWLLCLWGFSRQEYCSGLPCPTPRDVPNPGIEPRSPALQEDSLPAELPWKPSYHPNQSQYQ